MVSRVHILSGEGIRECLHGIEGECVRHWLKQHPSESPENLGTGVCVHEYGHLRHPTECAHPNRRRECMAFPSYAVSLTATEVTPTPVKTEVSWLAASSNPLPAGRPDYLNTIVCHSETISLWRPTISPGFQLQTATVSVTVAMVGRSMGILTHTPTHLTETPPGGGL